MVNAINSILTTRGRMGDFSPKKTHSESQQNPIRTTSMKFKLTSSSIFIFYLPAVSKLNKLGTLIKISSLDGYFSDRLIDSEADQWTD